MAKSSSAKNTPLTAAPDLWEKLSLKWKHTIGVAILLLLPTFLFPDVFWGDQRFVGHDTIQWRASSESIIAERETTGEEPLWSANQFSGMPAYLVSYRKMVPNIDNLIALPETLYPASFFWILLIGMYAFLLCSGFKPASAVLGSILVGFSTYMPIIIGAGHNSKMVALSFIPWLMFGYSMLRRDDRNKWLSAFVFTGAFILQLRAGHPQITYYFMFLLGLWFLYDLIQASREGRIKSFYPVMAFVVIAGLVTLLANAQPYWSIYEYSPYSIRGGGTVAAPESTGLDMEYAFRWSQGWGELLTLLIPNAYGGAEAYWGPKSGTSGPHYFGAVTMIFLILGLWKSTFKLKWVFFAAGVLSVLFAVGENFASLNGFMFQYFPLFNKFRAPETWLVLAGFTFPIIALAGFEYVLNKANEIKLKDWFPALAPVMLIALVFAFGSGAMLSFEKPGQFDQLVEQVASANQVSPSDSRVQQQVLGFINNTLKPERETLASADSLRLLILVTLSVGVIIAVSFRKIGAGVASLILIAVSGYDLISVGQRYANEKSLASKEFDAAAIVEQTRRPVDTWLAENVKTDEPWSYRVFPLADNAFNNAIPSYFYPSLGGYSGARMATYDDLMSRSIFVGEFGINVGVLNMLNTKYLTYGPGLSIPGWEQIQEFEGMAVYENSRVLPKAWFVGQVDQVLNAELSLAKINQFNFDPARMAVVETDSRLPEIVVDSTAIAGITEYSGRIIRIETNRSTGSGLLVLGELYYPKGWTATINGEPTEIFKTNFALRGIIVPEGTNTVELRFDPQSHTLGTTLAYAGHGIWLLFGVMAFVSMRKRRSDGAE